MPGLSPPGGNAIGESRDIGEYIVTPDGTASPSGVLSRNLFITRSGQTSPSGVVNQKAIISRDGTSSPTGKVLNKPLISLDGTSAPSGGVDRDVFITAEGQTSPSGTLNRNSFITRTGQSTPSGAKTNKIIQTLTGQSTPSGSLTNTIQVVFAGSSTPSGSFTVSHVVHVQYSLRDGIELEAQFKPVNSEQWVSVPSRNIVKNRIWVSPVEPGETYDVRVRGVTDIGLTTEWNYVRNHTIQGKDALFKVWTFSGTAVTQGTGKTVGISWDPLGMRDLFEYGVYRNTNDDFSGASKIAEVQTTSYTDPTVTIGETYHYWLTAFDTSENETGETKAGSVTVSHVKDDEADDTYQGSAPSAPTVN